jgi:hypothetical protein
MPYTTLTLKAILEKIKQHHMLHHYQDPTKGYGVSSPFGIKFLIQILLKSRMANAVGDDIRINTKSISIVSGLSIAYLLISYFLLLGFKTDQLNFAGHI